MEDKTFFTIGCHLSKDIKQLRGTNHTTLSTDVSVIGAKNMIYTSSLPEFPMSGLLQMLKMSARARSACTFKLFPLSQGRVGFASAGRNENDGVTPTG